MLRLYLHGCHTVPCCCAANPQRDAAQRPHQPISFWWHGSEYPEPNPDHEDAQTVFALMPHAHRQDSSWARVECDRLREVVLQLARVSAHVLLRIPPGGGSLGLHPAGTKRVASHGRDGMPGPSKLLWILAQAPPMLSVTAVRKGLHSRTTVTAPD